MKLFNKIKWILGILLIFVLILSTNLIDRNNFVRVKDSVETIYKDRLIASDLIFEMSKAIHKKEIALTTNDSLFYNNKNALVNNKIKQSITEYEDTKLTKSESEIFNTLKIDFNSLFALEKDGITSAKRTIAINKIISIKDELNNLSKIQLSEGSKQMAVTQKAIDSVELFTQIEIYFLVFLAIVIQIIVIYNPKPKED